MKLSAWHYTRGEKLAAIRALGVLRPATAGIPPSERPVVWFSLNQWFEPTALPGIVGQNGQRRAATLLEAQELGGGLYRFGVAPRTLLTGAALQRAARINGATWRALARAGQQVGANASGWFGHVGPLSIDGLLLQRLEHADGRLDWVAASLEPLGEIA